MILHTLARGALVVALPALLASCSDDSTTSEPESGEGVSASTPALDSVRHLLLISVDALRADFLGVYGADYDTTPNVDDLARGGTLFERCYSVMGTTLPSVASLMTSRYPDEHGAFTNHAMLSPEEVTLGECLREAGFRNRAMVANGALAAEYTRLDQGYDSGDFLRVDNEAELTERAVEMLGGDFGVGQREFLWLHYMAPHAPYEPPEQLVEAFDDGPYDGPYDGTNATLDPVTVDRVDLAPRDLAHIRALYAAEVNKVDRMIRRLLAALDQSGKRDETLVVFTADHGEEVYDHQYYFYHSNSPYRTVVGVPLIFSLPGVIPAGRRVEHPVSLVDVLPTLLGLLQVPYDSFGTDASPRGVDLRPTLFGRDRSPPRTYVHSQIMDRIYSVRTDRWAFIRNESGFMPRSVPEAGEFHIAPRELYDLEVDPKELRNVIDEHPEVAERLEMAMDGWLVGLDRSRPRTAPKLPPERLKELRELGYISGDGR